MKQKRKYIAALGLLTTGWISSASLAAPTPVAVSVERQSDGSHFVMGRFMVEASTKSAWNTLSDYDDLHSFVPSIRDSRRVKEEDKKIFVSQTMMGQAGFFRKKVSLLLEITETPPFKIEFHDIGGKSFRLYRGSWDIAQWDNGLAVTYQLYATPNFYAPEFIVNDVFKKDVQELLENVRDQILVKEHGG